MFWRSTDFTSLLIEEWEEEFIVFQPTSGKTHFLNKLGMQLLLELDKYHQSAYSEDQICQCLLDRFQLQSAPHFLEQVKKTLRRFEELGLVEQVKRDPVSAR
ncbi:MAG TPA: HPr-rel-A system PqqD family peptide chaperone [Nitrosomonas nitrosa]|jgi:PqqD family protein of HPr-rel-A system|uniref:PqqD family protein, HPr-rel-A system n=1 Tax=Nitrosomonas nitrosa TaxID=52442 RepID=A0A1I4QB33_9PROT|nr:HPr-rel-A system PqqD family peptide chaperone [Nitrosomonas nitrosa]MCO6433941.1 HPr-rel-A system PqqD family peptide chaperone [Nitrosomonas nitrosa]PTQ95455.1 PqqD family protein of HPr-rel-A system [Nitrosomonas nitrosa]CAE6501059.1 PqqD family protein, HPr-rel-A system [Nitrosomonas nitrosa]SFM36830.1 PqqD family protein, HPr-rel-A system [Nitrosomonas nitrosa]HBZ31278.1 HPr-rel-A system PqqD family peptide chaperone [Nitrosomonas nitrosa]